MLSEPVFQNAPGKLARGFPVLDGDGAIHDRGGDAFGLLHEAPRASRQILLNRREARFDALLVEDDEIRGIARAQQTAIRQFPRLTHCRMSACERLLLA